MIGTQIRPRPYLAMKLIASGVTCSAASARSPSFSRSSSSTMMTNFPCLKSSTASGMLANGDTSLPPLTLDPAPLCGPRTAPTLDHSLRLQPSREEAFDVFRDDVHFNIHALARRFLR